MNRNFTALLLLLLTLVASSILAIHPIPAAAVTLYASTGEANVDGGGQIYRIDTQTQTVTLVIDTFLNRLGGIDFNASGVLYGVDNGARGTSSLYTISLTNIEFSTTFIGVLAAPVGVQGVDALRFE